MRLAGDAGSANRNARRVGGGYRKMIGVAAARCRRGASLPPSPGPPARLVAALEALRRELAELKRELADARAEANRLRGEAAGRQDSGASLCQSARRPREPAGEARRAAGGRGGRRGDTAQHRRNRAAGRGNALAAELKAARKRAEQLAAEAADQQALG